MSTFSWLDYSDRDRRRVLDVVRALNERDTRDELGLASVRDALADLLAPGVSTIQTRVRYFLFIPWTYLRLEERRRKRSGPTTKDWIDWQAREAEMGLIQCLKQSGDSGVIGSSAGRSLQRLPSSVYWNGLREWGIRLCPMPIDGYHRHLAFVGPPPKMQFEGGRSTGNNWDSALPSAPPEFPKDATMQLTMEEARYLQDRILEHQSGSLLGQLLLADPRVAQAPDPWAALDLDVDLAPGVATALRHARAFSLAMHGAVLIYNLMLAEAQRSSEEDWTERYTDLLGSWSEDVAAAARGFATWNREDFWRTVRRKRPQVPLTTQRFIDTWLDLLLEAHDPLSLANSNAIRNLIANREHQLKRAQARLRNPRLLERWNGETGVGMGRMNFRWDVMKSHVADIHAGLRSESEVRVA